MRNLLQHVSKTSAYETRSIARIAPRLAKLQVSPITSQFICVQCRFRTSTANSKTQRLGPDLERSWPLRQSRKFSSRSSLGKDEKPEGISPAPQAPKLTIPDSIETDHVPLPPRTERPKVHAVPDEDLPSYRERMRSRLGKRFNELMDDLMPKLALASQRINTYTGTDYSGIAALRKEIIEQGIHISNSNIFNR
jgi:sensitive to high expression protein 9